jgi:hypothetical protein
MPAPALFVTPTRQASSVTWPQAAADEEGLRLVLTPVQLSAMLMGEHINPHEMMINRFWGAARVVGGALEMVTGSALLLTPEPTMVTKVGGVLLAAHGIDDSSTGLRQLWTGESEKSLTQRAGEGVAYTLGANQAQAERTGIVLDVAVPLVVAGVVGAARVMSIRSGRIALAEHEAMGGHTILKHVGKTEAELRARLVAEPRIPAAGSFSSLRIAESVISDAMRKEAPLIRQWAAGPQLRPYRFSYLAGKDVGYGVVRATGSLAKMNKIRVVLKATQVNGKLYFILTSFPEP